VATQTHPLVRGGACSYRDVRGLASGTLDAAYAPVGTVCRWADCVLFALMEHRTTSILHACYRVGSGIDERLAAREPSAIYWALHVTQVNLLTYSNLLRLAYAATALALFVSAVMTTS
jgi:hypothetical protein